MKNAKDTFDRYLDFNSSVLKDDAEAALLYKSIRNGTREYSKVHRNENTAADISWVKKVEDGVSHISKIIAAPRSFIKTVEYLVPAELAKKTGPASVVHLATHSQYVKKIEDNGDVIPSKILTTEGELDVQIYENRFIMTLIKRLRIYIEKRYTYLKHFAALSDMDIFYVNNTFKMGETTINATSTITLSTPDEAVKSLKEKVSESLTLVETLRKYISFFSISDFMKVQMKGARPVVPPIMQTNMLKSQPDYHGAYQLWLFLNEEEHVSMDFIVNEEVKGLTLDEQKRIDFLNYLTTLDLLNLEKMKTVRYTKNKYTSTIVPSLDDMLYLNDKFTEPVEFIRTDEQYYSDLAKPIIKKVENKTSKVVKSAYKIERKHLMEIENQKKLASALKRRKQAELKKQEAALEKQRLKDAEELAKREREEKEFAKLQRQDELELMRKEVTAAAKEEAKVLSEKEDHNLQLNGIEKKGQEFDSEAQDTEEIYKAKPKKNKKSKRKKR